MGQMSKDQRATASLAAFGAWVTYRNWAFKPGIQVPVYNNLSGGALDYRFVAAIELPHLRADTVGIASRNVNSRGHAERCSMLQDV